MAGMTPPQIPDEPLPCRPGVRVPRLLASYDLNGWVALVLEDVDGVMPAQPWRTDELEWSCAPSRTCRPP